MKRYTFLILFLAFSLIAGGAVGYIKAGSVPSLLVSSASGALLIFFALRQTLWSFFWAALLIISLNLFFFIRLFLTGRLMPNAAIVLLTTIVGIPLVAYLKKNAHLLASKEELPLE